MTGQSVGQERDERTYRGIGPHRPDPRAGSVASQVAALIAAARAGTVVDHVGSTAVPGLIGKNVVDLQITAGPAEVPAITSALIELGFARQRGPDPWPPERPMLEGTFRCGGGVFLLHCHVVPDTDADASQMIEFRDLLRRSLARRAGTCTLQPIRCSSTSSPARVYPTPNRRRTTSAMRASVQHWSSSHPQAAGPASSTASSSPTWAGVSLHGPPPGPFDISAARPPAASARRHRFANIRVTRKRFATSRSLAPASIWSAAANRTCSRRARSAAGAQVRSVGRVIWPR